MSTFIASAVLAVIVGLVANAGLGAAVFVWGVLCLGGSEA